MRTTRIIFLWLSKHKCVVAELQDDDTAMFVSCVSQQLVVKAVRSAPLIQRTKETRPPALCARAVGYSAVEVASVSHFIFFGL